MAKIGKVKFLEHTVTDKVFKALMTYDGHLCGRVKSELISDRSCENIELQIDPDYYPLICSEAESFYKLYRYALNDSFAKIEKLPLFLKVMISLQCLEDDFRSIMEDGDSNAILLVQYENATVLLPAYKMETLRKTEMILNEDRSVKNTLLISEDFFEIELELNKSDSFHMIHLLS